MLKILSYKHLFTYSILFVFAFVLRLPSFHPNYFQEDEAFYLVSAEKIVDGGMQYVDTVDNKPPLIVWFYSLFVLAFGNYAIIAIRIFACIYLYVGALLLNQFVVDNKLLEKFSLLPAFLMIFLCSVPWYAQELNGEILMTVPLILAVFQVMKVTERSRQNNAYLFFAGLLLGICFMIKYQAILLFFGLLGAYLSIHTPRLSETFSLFAGFIMTVLITVAAVYLTGAIEAFWDIGVVYNLDYIFVGKNPGEQVSPLFNLGQYMQLWGVFIILALLGLAHFRLNYFTNTIRLRKTEALVLFWFIASLLTVVIGGGRLYLHYFYLLVPPLVIYVSKVFEFRIGPWLRSAILFLAFFVPVFTFGVYVASAYPKTFSFIDPYINKGGWIESFRAELNNPHPLEAYIDKSQVRNGILVMDYEPTTYARLGLRCATKYTNFSVAYYKLSVFRNRTGTKLISHTDGPAEVYEAFSAEMPDYVIDPLDLFPLLQNKMPNLFADYAHQKVTDGDRSYKIYQRQ